MKEIQPSSADNRCDEAGNGSKSNETRMRIEHVSRMYSDRKYNQPTLNSKKTNWLLKRVADPFPKLDVTFDDRTSPWKPSLTSDSLNQQRYDRRQFFNKKRLQGSLPSAASQRVNLPLEVCSLTNSASCYWEKLDTMSMFKRPFDWVLPLYQAAGLVSQVSSTSIYLCLLVNSTTPALLFQCEWLC